MRWLVRQYYYKKLPIKNYGNATFHFPCWRSHFSLSLFVLFCSVCLPSQLRAEELLQEGLRGFVTGWGNTEEGGDYSRYLRRVRNGGRDGGGGGEGGSCMRAGGGLGWSLYRGANGLGQHRGGRAETNSRYLQRVRNGGRGAGGRRGDPVWEQVEDYGKG